MKSFLTLESHWLGIQCQMGGILLLNLNMRLRPIEKKYCEGTLKRISKEKSKEHEMERREQNESGRVI